MHGLLGQPPATFEHLLYSQVSYGSLVLLHDGCHHLVEPRDVAGHGLKSQRLFRWHLSIDWIHAQHHRIHQYHYQYDINIYQYHSISILIIENIGVLIDR